MLPGSVLSLMLGLTNQKQKNIAREEGSVYGRCTRDKSRQRRKLSMWKEREGTPMRQPTVDTTSGDYSTAQSEKTEYMPQEEDVVLDLNRRLESYRRTHPYKEIQIEGRK